MAQIQKKLTITVEQQDFLKANRDKMTIGQLAKFLGLPYQKTHNNLRVLGLVGKRKKQKKQYKVVEGTIARVVDFDTKGFFDIKKWGKLYNY